MGDARYDVAKLYHSVHGHYDFHHERSVHGARRRAEARPRAAHARRPDQDSASASRRRSSSGRAHRSIAARLLLMTGLLFASMLPLHDDQPRRQLAMYATALKLLDEVFTP